MLRDKLERFLDLFSTHHCRVCKTAVLENSGQNYLCDCCYQAALNSIHNSRKVASDLDIFFVTDYEDWARDMMRDYKYRQRHLARFWAKLIADYIKAEWQTKVHDIPIYVTSVPLHPQKLTERGFDQAELLSKFLIKELKHKLNLEYLPQIIKRKKYTPSLFKLDAKQRISILKDAFEVNPIYNHSPEFSESLLLIIDDIVTTGSTLNICAKTIYAKLGFAGILAITATGRNLD